ncbi:type I-E CRISPR-associated protein Cse1/CasA [Spirillospora sp. NPDC047279]|uniref:type I-E CRISPR-associated protein Cse1/CasA n=1 Tax=Spirillospora sp. NPDC047279 TaxID=3155478 RepID=UPI00340A224B
MANERLRFDLTGERWLPVLRMDGSHDVLSLRDVFAQAGDLRRIVGDLPTQEFALMRLLLAILHDAVDGPRDLDAWEDLWENGLPVGRLQKYLDDHVERFDLLHPDMPFLQTPSLHTVKDEVSSLDKIVADVPNGARLFTMRGRGVDRLTYAEAARWLVHTHAFDTSGIKSGAVGDPRVKGGKGYPQGVAWAGSLGGVLAVGDDLRTTLLLNLIAFDTGTLQIDPRHDRPAWRREVPTAAPLSDTEAARRPHGVRDLYTWPSRRVRLHFDDTGVLGVVLAYGDPLAAHNKHRLEPMTAWRRSPAQEKKLREEQIYLPREHDPARTAWRGLGAVIAGRAEGAQQRNEAAAIVRPRILDWVARLTVEGLLPQEFLLRARLIGARYGTQQSVIDEMIDDEVQMPVVLLHDQDHELGIEAIDAVADADQAVRLLGDLAAGLATAAGDSPEPRKDTARNQGYALLDGPFRSWLAALSPGDDPDTVRTAWRRTAYSIIRRVGADLVAGAGDAAWQGRVVTAKEGRTIWLSATRAEQIFLARLAQALPAGPPPSTIPASSAAAAVNAPESTSTMKASS